MGADGWTDNVPYLSVRCNTLMIKRIAKEEKSMKKKKIRLACLLAAGLTGCGSGAAAGNEAGTEPGNEAGAAADSELNIEVSGMESEAGTEPENEAGAAADSELNSEAENDSQEQTAEEENVEEENAFVFGDSATMDYNVNGRELPIYCVDTEEKKIALSFDAAWGNEDTAELLAILEEHNLKVTFFMTGGWVESYPEDVKAILAAGHDLGNHSENHKNMSELSDAEKKEEIMSVHQKVQEITGYEMFLFRPPYGDYDNALIDVLKDCEYYPIQWDVDSLDWKNEGVDELLETVTGHKNLGNGSIILCHNGAEYTAEALDTLINELEAQGYEIVPISELIYRENYHMNVQGRQISDDVE